MKEKDQKVKKDKQEKVFTFIITIGPLTSIAVLVLIIGYFLGWF